MIEFVQKPVSEIQAIRELESSGDLKKQTEHLANVIESKAADSEELAVEMTMMVQQMAMDQAKAITELTTMMVSMGGMK
ncbi:hypothetical protein [Peptoniphilus duerdenii]|uniref:hypothetical protein n=1 Tax=Peptoniphilus duerdenii TaxID=507750 RepID=UPI00288AC39B|nr:hypothetical protein [Peptoniphilus duerdenii]